MKKFLIPLTAAVAIAATVWAAAPLHKNGAKNVGDVTVSTALASGSTATAWQLMDSLICIASDSATVRLTATGIAEFTGRQQQLYFGWDRDTTTASTSLDTFIVTAGSWTYGTQSVPFSLSAIYTVTAANTDTCYFRAAIASANRAVVVKDLVISAVIGDDL